MSAVGKLADFPVAFPAGNGGNDSADVGESVRSGTFCGAALLNIDDATSALRSGFGGVSRRSPAGMPDDSGENETLSGKRLGRRSFCRMSLPEDFPDAWDEDGAGAGFDDAPSNSEPVDGSVFGGPALRRGVGMNDPVWFAGADVGTDCDREDCCFETGGASDLSGGATLDFATSLDRFENGGEADEPDVNCDEFRDVGGGCEAGCLRGIDPDSTSLPVFDRPLGVDIPVGDTDESPGLGRDGGPDSSNDAGTTSAITGGLAAT